MVDKVDRPEAPSPYMVPKSTETKRDKPQEERRQEDLPTFQKKDEDLYKEKFQREGAPPKTFKVALNEVKEFLFIRAIPRHGVPMADADLVWKDGKKLPGVSFLIKNWQDFMRIKNLKHGEAIPPPFWNYVGAHLEITMRSVSTSGPWNLKEIESKSPLPQPPPTPVRRLFGGRGITWWWVLGGFGILAVIIILLSR